MSLSISPITPIIPISNQDRRQHNNHHNNSIKGDTINSGIDANTIIIPGCLSLPISIAIDPLMQKTREDMNILVGITHYFE